MLLIQSFNFYACQEDGVKNLQSGSQYQSSRRKRKMQTLMKPKHNLRIFNRIGSDYPEEEKQAVVRSTNGDHLPETL